MANINPNANKNEGMTGQAAAQTATDLKDKAKDAASTLADKARDAAGQATDKARDIAGDVSRKAGDAVGAAGHGLRTAAEAIRSRSPDTGMLGTASSRVADVLDRGGRYLEEEKLSGMAEDVTDLVRRYPIPALLVGFGLGFLVARTVSRG